MSPPLFDFDHRTGHLERQGQAVTLRRLHADIFDCFAKAQAPMTCRDIERAIGIPARAINDEMPAFAKRLKPLGINIGMQRGGNHAVGGRWLEFEDVQKWQPNIPPPVCLPGEGRP